MPEPTSKQGDALRNCIRRLRFEHGEMTQEELGRRAGVTRQTILAIEAGKYAPSLPLAFRIARAFGARVEDVFQYQKTDGNGISKDSTSSVASSDNCQPKEH